MDAQTISPASEYEIERGKPMPSEFHGAIQGNLIGRLLPFTQFRVVSEVTITLNGKDYVPDISILPRRPLNAWNDRVTVPEPPIVAIEIISPSQGYADFVAKAQIYLDCAVKSVWLVNPVQETVTIYRSHDGYETWQHGETLEDSATGIKVDVSSLFV